MHQYGVRDVEKLLNLSRGTIHSLVKAGFVSPTRGPHRTYLFSFQDLIVLRTAQALAAANVPARRITRSLKELRRQLPESVPLSGLSICAVADRVVVKEGGSRWQADSGQYLLALDVEPSEGSLSVIERRGPDADEWFERALALEADDAEGARRAYERAIASNGAHLSAHVNLGLLLHERGRFAEAESAYRRALHACGGDPVLHYNLGVLLEDMERKEEALAAYEQALRSNPQFADCHYNLALLCEDLDKPAKAIRHMAHYRRLVATRPPDRS
jgi:tetratricopeptide (TPR) repeat protein